MDTAGVRAALVRYRIMAYVVGVLLILLMCVALPLHLVKGDDRLSAWLGIPHGWLYMVLLVTAWDLGRRVQWTWTRLLLIALAGTVPFLSFVAEYSARKNVQAKLAASEVKERTPVDAV